MTLYHHTWKSQALHKMWRKWIPTSSTASRMSMPWFLASSAPSCGNNFSFKIPIKLFNLTCCFINWLYKTHVALTEMVTKYLHANKMLTGSEQKSILVSMKITNDISHTQQSLPPSCLYIIFLRNLNISYFVVLYLNIYSTRCQLLWVSWQKNTP